MRISVNGRNITRFFQRSAGAYRATLRPGHGLRPGVNHLFVKTRDYKDFDRVSFIVARRVPELLRLTDLDVDEPGAPVRVEVRVGRGATLRAWVNGHRVDRACQPQGRGYVGRLGANDWVRPGRNRLVVLVHRARRSGRSAVHDVESTTFRLRGVIAGAGRDRVVDAGDFIELRASAAGARGDLDYHWAIVDAPDGGDDAVLEHEETATPEFVATTPGRYRIRATVRAANDTSSAASAASASSADTVTVTVRTDVPPIGWRLHMGSSPRGTILLNGAPVADTTKCVDPAIGVCELPFITYAIFNRQTLERVTSGTLYYQGPDLKFLADLAAQYSRAPNSLMLVTSSITTGDLYWVRLLNTLGVGDASAARDAHNYGSPVSIVGVPGSPAGSAFVSAGYCRRDCDRLPLNAASMSGYLRLNPGSATGGDFEFVRTDQVEFSTDVSTTPGQVTMKVGDYTYTGNVPTDGSSGFFLVTLNSQRLMLAPLSQEVFVTNDPNGSENPSEDARMANTLAAAVEGDNSRGRALVMLQAFGKPKGQQSGWQSAQQSIEKLGGNGQLFAQLNQGRPDEPHQGRYALVGRAAMGAPAAESSESLTGKATDGTLHGLLARARDDQYLPLLAGPAGSINFDLVNIVNRFTAPNGGFPTYTGGEAAAVQFLARAPDPRTKDPLIMGVCAFDAPACDVRKSYYEKYDGVDWATILNALGQKARRACAAAAEKPGAPFTNDECQTVREQLETEVDARNRVATYFGPGGLQGPFKGAAGVSALVNIAAISAEIERDVKPPAADNAASHALNIINYVVKIVGAGAGLVAPGAATAANGVSAAFGLAAYLTNHDGSPDLIGPEVSQRATDLGVDLTDRYQRVSSYFTTEAKIIVSDLTKMREVAALTASDPKWSLNIDVATKQLNLATKQTIYQALVPVAYPVLYDLGTGITHAKDWICRSVPTFLYDKNLFQNTGTGAELPYLVPGNAQSYSEHVMAVGAKRAVGSLHDAYIPAPADTLTEKLFRDPADREPGGIGVYKLQFYSPQNFRVFPTILQQTQPLAQDYGYWTCQDMPKPPGNAG